MTIEAMRQALEALEMLLSLDTHDEMHLLETDIAPKAIVALKQAIEQADKQEPVAVWELQEDGWDTIADPDWMEKLPVGTKLYTAPQKPEWDGLTDDDIDEILIDLMRQHAHGAISIARAVEAKLKGKNHDHI
jgi:hypothetical protein